MHIASLMGTPAVIIYGPTDPIVNEPLGSIKRYEKKWDAILVGTGRAGNSLV